MLADDLDGVAGGCRGHVVGFRSPEIDRALASLAPARRAYHRSRRRGQRAARRAAATRGSAGERAAGPAVRLDAIPVSGRLRREDPHDAGPARHEGRALPHSCSLRQRRRHDAADIRRANWLRSATSFTGWPMPSEGRCSTCCASRASCGPAADSRSAPTGAGWRVGDRGRCARRADRRLPSSTSCTRPYSRPPSPLHVPTVMFTHNVEAEIFARHLQVARNPLMRAMWRSQHAQDAPLRAPTRSAASTSSWRCPIATHAASSDDYGVDRALRDSDRRGPGLSSAGAAGPGREVVFCGSMDWLANQDGVDYFMDEIWARIVPAPCRSARMTVVGRAPPAGTGRSALGGAGSHGTSPASSTTCGPIVQGAAVSVIPLRVGGGTRLKVYRGDGHGIAGGVHGARRRGTAGRCRASTSSRPMTPRTVCRRRRSRLLRDPDRRAALSQESRAPGREPLLLPSRRLEPSKRPASWRRTSGRSRPRRERRVPIGADDRHGAGNARRSRRLALMPCRRAGRVRACRS